MSRATRSPAPQVPDTHELIRVHCARVNNLKDVSIELPKRRLTVFTGISGSGRSSLVFGTIAAESPRLINETYSAFHRSIPAGAGVVSFDQGAIRGSRRSNPATYTDCSTRSARRSPRPTA
jgi:excinuclease UvrABC ATPase subunit